MLGNVFLSATIHLQDHRPLWTAVVRSGALNTPGPPLNVLPRSMRVSHFHKCIQATHRDTPR